MINFDFTQNQANFLFPGTYILKIIYARIIIDKNFFEPYYKNKEM